MWGCAQWPSSNSVLSHQFSAAQIAADISQPFFASAIARLLNCFVICWPLFLQFGSLNLPLLGNYLPEASFSCPFTDAQKALKW